MNEYYISPSDDKVKHIIRVAFPGYTGRKCKVSFRESDSPMNLHSFWDGGSRDYFAIVWLAARKVINLGSSHPIFEKGKYGKGLDSFVIPEGFVVVEHSFFCGKDHGITIHVRADDSSSGLLQESKDDLSELEVHTLLVTQAYKSSYAGIKDLRARELKRKFGYSQSEVDKARDSLIKKGYMNRNRAINRKGKNAITSHPLRYRI